MVALIRDTWPVSITSARPAAPPDGPGWLDLPAALPGFQLALLDEESGELLAACNSVPLAWAAPLDQLPDEGWDWAQRQSAADRAAGRPGHTLCALAVTVGRAHQGQGLSRVCLSAFKDLARRRGMQRLIVPVRPSWKARYPLADMADYMRWEDGRGLPLDPWLRTHARVGGRLLRACPRSMQMVGSVAEWSDWLGMPLPQSGRYTAPGLLCPLEVDLEADLCRYIEPNVWVEHPLT